MKVKEVLNALERFAPLPLQEDYDNAGLQTGLPEAEVSGALLCLDVTEDIISEALSRGCNLIVAHHPLIFHKLAHITDENYVQRTVMKAIQNNVAIIAMHTNLDCVSGGVNFKIAEKMRLTDLAFIGSSKRVDGYENGEGLIGSLSEAMAADDFMVMLKQTFGVECVQSNQFLRRPIRRVALCGGAGSFLLDEAVRAGADAFVTGEMSYHQFFGREQQIQIAVIGHYQSEQYTAEVLKTVLKDAFPELKCMITEQNTNPILYI